MNKKIFLQKLKNALAQMDEQEKNEILSDYEEHFLAAAESGKSEQEIINALGDPLIIAKSYSSEKIIKQLESKKPFQKKVVPLAQSYFLVASLGFFNVIVFGIPYFLAFVITLSIWLSSVLLTLSNLYNFGNNIVSSVLNFDLNKGSAIFYSLGGVFLGILLLNIAYLVTNWLLKLFIKHVQLSLKVAGLDGEKRL
ncbi:DUF1700 domain-containing protein [Pigmentibacter sp. JX0631]|uniref:DUF1700 domain-containing protein n=1 Tax=Pigmentibacter sp. JX0631 TaxID=2976982 RepID=UPI0024688344|nr:DUF1700 domain-containing protein [Pigmentibacter sp. JX0631]WGL59789.1 DUF1700 domain-containing protein [Pigmentibacter sp. JX0631]